METKANSKQRAPLRYDLNKSIRSRRYQSAIIPPLKGERTKRNPTGI